MKIRRRPRPARRSRERSFREHATKSGDYQPGADAIQVVTMHARKGLEFLVVALPGVGHMPAPGEDEKEAARVFYVAATWARQRLIIAASGENGFGKRLEYSG